MSALITVLLENETKESLAVLYSEALGQVRQLEEEKADYQTRLWCALGQPLNIEYIEAVKQQRNQVRQLQEIAGDVFILAKYSKPQWGRDDFLHELGVRLAALAATEPKP